MPKYVIEREMPGVGALQAAQLNDTSKKSNLLIRELGSEIKWLTSYVTDDKIYCVYVAPSEEVIFEHARCLDIPADRVSKVVATIDPSTGE